MTENHDELAKRVPRSEMTRAVAAAYPALIEALEKAGEAYYQNEDTWQEEATRQQHAGRMPELELQSPYRRGLRETAKAVVEKFEDMLASGAVTWPPEQR